MNNQSALTRFRGRSLAVLAGTAAISLQFFAVQGLAASGEPEVHKAEVASATGGKGSKGEALFQANCAACHQANGQGLPGAFPPLAGSDYIAQNPKVLMEFTLQGKQGKMTVNGKE